MAGTPLRHRSHHGNIAGVRMLCGCIDIGTNTTRVLVAHARDGRLTEVLQRRAFARLGRGLTPGGAIPAARIAENASVVAEQVALAEQVGAQSIRTVATAVIRSAANRDEFCRAMREHGGVDVCVLDGEEEARLAFLGATKTLETRLDGRVAVVDVGGGSTEIAVGTDTGGVEWWESFALGSGFLADAYLGDDPPSLEQLDEVRWHAAQVLADVHPPPVDVAVAVGGSAASLRRLVGDVLDHQSLARASRDFTSGSGRGRRLPLRSRPPAGAADAGRAARARGRGPYAGPAAADRARRFAGGRLARPGRDVTSSFTEPGHRWCDHSRP